MAVLPGRKKSGRKKRGDSITEVAARWVSTYTLARITVRRAKKVGWKLRNTR